MGQRVCLAKTLTADWKLLLINKTICIFKYNNIKTTKEKENLSH